MSQNVSYKICRIGSTVQIDVSTKIDPSQAMGLARNSVHIWKTTEVVKAPFSKYKTTKNEIPYKKIMSEPQNVWLFVLFRRTI